MSAPIESHEPLTPAAMEAKLRDAANAVHATQRELARARDVETARQSDHLRARVVAASSPDCPVPSRATGVTVGQRADWIDAQALDALLAYNEAKQARVIAREAAHAAESIATVGQSLNASVRQAYSMGGRS